MNKLDTRSIRAILFDVDGTLFSSEEIIYQIYRQCFETFQKKTGKPDRVPALSEIMAQIGKPVRQIFAALTPELSEEERSMLSEDILAVLVKAIGNGQGEHYPGASETIVELARRGYQIHATSNGRKPYIEAILRANGTLAFFQPVEAVNGQSIADKSQLVAHVLSRHSLKPHEAALVGDRLSDRDAALQNNVLFLACSYGHGSQMEHTGAACVISRIAELLEIFGSPAQNPNS